MHLFRPDPRLSARCTKRALATLLLWGLSHAHGADTPRFICTLADGSPRIVATDLSVGFPESTAQCTPVVAEMSAPQAPPRAALRLGQVTLIDATGAEFEWPRSRAPRASSSLTAIPPELAAQIDTASARQQLDPELVGALIYVESRYRSDAVSPKGAIGLMQVMPATARRYGVKTARQLFDPAVNLDVGTRHLRDLQAVYGRRVDLVLAAYNAGEGAVARYGHRVPPYAETRAYVAQIGSLLGVAGAGR